MFAHSDDTVEGALRHQTLGERRSNCRRRSAGGERIHSRSVSLSSDRCSLTAVINPVEGQSGLSGRLQASVPLASATMLWRRGRPRAGLGAGLVLREHGYTCDETVVYYNRCRVGH